MFKTYFLYYFQLINLFIGFINGKNFKELKYLKPKNSYTVVDIGSNTGSYIKFISKVLRKKNLNIYSFEPIKELISLQQKISLPKNHKLMINNCAISDFKGETKLYIRELISQSSIFSSHNLINELSNIKEERVVKVEMLGNFIKNHGVEYIDILKIDTEGSELQILKSCEKQLDKKIIKQIKIELTNDLNFFEIIQFLEKKSYQLQGFTNFYYKKNKLIFCDAHFEVL